MNVLLMFEEYDFIPDQDIPENEWELMQDLELNTLCEAMASDNEFLLGVAKKTLLLSLHNDVNTILYRQAIFKDCLKNSSTIRNIYSLAIEAIESQKKNFYRIFMKHPAYILSDSLDLLNILLDMLKQLTDIANKNGNKFESKGFTRFFAMLKDELGTEYYTKVQDYLKELKFRDGILIGAKLGKFNKGESYALRKPEEKKPNWLKRLITKKQNGNTFYIAPGDEGGSDALSDLRNKGLNVIANVLAQSTDHILSFFTTLQTELAFYICCLNLHAKLTQLELPISFPSPLNSNERNSTFQELYDVCLALSTKQKIVTNDMSAINKNLVVITGANQGGKSTFLRSIGVSQLMMQSGMFVPAKSLCANICDSLFTHYQREEDTTMKSGKLDEELSRMNTIIDQLTPNSLLLLNESFAATNEREGSEIASQIIKALMEKRIKIFYVTHLYEFAHDFFEKRVKDILFLRAERKTDGKRTFKLIEDTPLQTSYGIDLYNKIFS